MSSSSSTGSAFTRLLPFPTTAAAAEEDELLLLLLLLLLDDHDHVHDGTFTGFGFALCSPMLGIQSGSSSSISSAFIIFVFGMTSSSSSNDLLGMTSSSSCVEKKIYFAKATSCSVDPRSPAASAPLLKRAGVDTRFSTSPVPITTQRPASSRERFFYHSSSCSYCLLDDDDELELDEEEEEAAAPGYQVLPLSTVSTFARGSTFTSTGSAFANSSSSLQVSFDLLLYRVELLYELRRHLQRVFLAHDVLQFDDLP